MRADRYRKKNNRFGSLGKKKGLLLVLIFLLTAGVIAELYTLLTVTSIDRRFARSVWRGLYESWSLDTNEMQLQDSGKITDTAFINAEWDAMSEYRKKKYKDDDLGHLANEYISALNGCRKAALTHDPLTDYSAFWSEFSIPYGRRLKALYSLYTGDFGFDVDTEQFEKEASMLLAHGWLLDTIDHLSFNKTDKDGVQTFTAKIRNNSGSDIEYLDLGIHLLDKEGKTSEISSAYVTDVPAGGIMDIRFICTSDKAVSYRIVSEDLKLKRH